MRRLRHHGIYKLPDATRPFYPITAGEKLYLYDYKFGSRVPPRFVVEEDGRLVNWHGDLMPMTIEDLIDTNEDCCHRE